MKWNALETCGHSFSSSRTISGVPVVLGGQVDELAVAVVLGDRTCAVRVDAAWDLSVLELVSREPLEKLLHFLGVTEAKKCGRGERAVADP